VGALSVRLGPAHVTFTDRHGGVSETPFDTANLGLHTDDAPDRVDENRRRLASTLAPAGVPGDHAGWVWLRQVHGAAVAELAGPPASPPAADAAVTRTRGLPLVVLTADCAPIALASDDALAVVHAGWPGLLAGVVETAVDRLRAHGSGPVRAALGPCIHPDRYEFGRDDLDRVAARLGDTVRARTTSGRPALDIPAAVRAALKEVGVDDVVDCEVCTSASSDHFSYRRDGPTGRQGLVAFLT
jgi:polyphenol oxidase